MKTFEREINEDERREAIDERRRRSSRGCLCNLDGFPGTCPGAENCPYSGLHDDDEEEDDDE